MRHPKVGFLVQQGLVFPILQIHGYMRVVIMILYTGHGRALLEMEAGDGVRCADLLSEQLVVYGAG